MLAFELEIGVRLRGLVVILFVGWFFLRWLFDDYGAGKK